MRDWDGNGRIDARDRYIFHEIILKDDEPTADTSYYKKPVRRYAETKKSEPKKLEDMSGYEIFFKAVFGILVLIGLFVAQW